MNYLLTFLLSVGLAHLLASSKKWKGSILVTTFIASIIFLGLQKRLLGILIAGMIIFFIGWCEERRWVNPGTKIFIVILAGVIVYISGVRIDFITHPFGEFIYLGHLSLLATVLWIVSVTLLVALIDRLEGLTCSISLITSLAFFVVAQLQRPELSLASTLSVVIAGGVLGILKFNFYPARISLSKSGGMFLGFMLSILAIIGASKSTALFLLFLPILISGAPVLLVTASIFYCYLRGSFQPIPSSSILVLRMNTGQAVLMVSFISLGLGVVAISLHFGTFLISGILGLSGLLAFLGLGGRFLFERRSTYQGHQVLPGRIPILEVMVDRVGFEEAVGRIDGFIKSGKPHHVITLNSLLVLEAKRDRLVEKILEGADLLVPDGIGLIWAAEFYGLPLKERVAGIDLLRRICELSAKKGYRIALLGGRDGVARAAAAELIREYPELRIVGIHHGYHTVESTLLSKLKEERPDVLFVGLGAPYQERWIKTHLSELGIPVLMGVGGSFDVIGKGLSRAPVWMINRGLEWLYRLYLQPWRISRIFSIPQFVFEVFIHKIKLNDRLVNGNR